MNAMISQSEINKKNNERKCQECGRIHNCDVSVCWVLLPKDGKGWLCRFCLDRLYKEKDV